MRQYLNHGHEASVAASSIAGALGARVVIHEADAGDANGHVATFSRRHRVDGDVLVPWAASAGGAAVAFTDRADRERRLGAISARLEAGGDH